MSKFINRSFEIISNTLKETGKEYTSNIQSLISDARDIKSNLTKSATDASDTFARLKTSNVTKKISDWFYGEENSFDSSMGDDFDAGFKIDDSEGAKLDGEDKPKSLDVDSMSDIANKQSATALKIGRRQTEQSVANTAEIISVVNNRSSEMLASINNINKTLLGISDRLDKIIKIQTTGFEDKKEEKEIDKGGLYSDGKLSLGRIFEASKKGLGNNNVIGSLSLLTQLVSGGARPEDIAKMGLGLVKDKKLDVLGGKSIDEIGKRFNEAIGTATQAALNEIIGSKPFQKLFGDITSFEGDKDYGTIIKNSYDTKKAQFDGMTRHTIVNLIPEMLANINESISGVSWHISNNGGWVKGPAKNEFASVTKQAFASTGLSQTVQDRINTVGKQTLGDKFSEADVDTAAKALNAVIVQDLHQRGSRQFRLTDLKGDMSQYVIPAVRTLCGLKNDPEYWASVCNTIILQLSSGIMNSQTFIQNINQSLQNMMSDAIDFAQSGKRNATQASKITQDMVMAQFWNEHKDQYIKPGESGSSDDSGKITDGRIKTASGSNEKYTNNEYLGNIFRLLNRGINVRTTGKDPFPELALEHNPDKPLPTTDQAFGKAMAALINGGGVNDDEDLIKKTVNSVMNGAANSLTGNNAGGGNPGGGGSGLGSFLGNFLGIAGGRGMSSLMDRALNGTLKSDIKNLFGKEGKVGKAASSAMGKIKDVTGSITGRFAYDQRARDAGEAITEKGRNLKGKIVGKAHDIKDRVENSEAFQNVKEKGSRLINNNIYHSDSRQLIRAEKRVENFAMNPEDIEDVDDRVGAELFVQCIKNENYEEAETIASCIKDKQLRTALEKHVKDIKKIKDIKEKRNKGETALANGETPEVGSVLQNAPEATNAPEDENNPKTIFGKIFGVVKKGFGTVGKVLGKIAKFTAKMAASGAINLTMGLKTMAEGFFGGKRRDVDGNVILDENGNPVKDKGLAGLAVGAFAGTAKALVKAPGAAVKGIGKLARGAADRVWNGKKVTDEDGNETRTSGLGDMQFSRRSNRTARDVIGNMTVTGKRVRYDSDTKDADGTEHKKGDIKRDEKGRAILTETKSVADLIKEPGKVLGETLKNIAGDIKIGGGKVKDAIGGLAKKFSTKVFGKKNDEGKREGGIMGKLKNSKLINNAAINGMTQGFKQAKAAKAKMKSAMSEAQARAESGTNELIGQIKDIFTGKSDANPFEAIIGLLTDIKGTGEEQLKATEEGNEAAEDEANKAETDENTPSTPESGQTGGGSSEIGGSSDDSTGGSSTESSSGGGGSSEAGEAAASSVGDAVSEVGGSIGGGGGGGGKNPIVNAISDLGGSIGKMFGGMGQAIFGIAELVLSAVMALEGLQALMGLFQNLIGEMIEPLNGIFEGIIDAISPTLDALKGLVHAIIEPVVAICKAIIGVVQPILDAICEIINQVIGFLNPIFDMIVALVDAILAPFMEIFESILMPIVETIGYTLQIISGVLQFASGIIIGLLGMIVTAIGTLIAAAGSLVPVVGGPVKKLGESIANTGKELSSTGKNLREAGAEQFKEGLNGIISQINKVLPGDLEVPQVEDDKKEGDADTSKITLGEDFGAGDVNTSTINNSWSYMYGSGNNTNTTMNQHSYGNYMNMGERGCGPVVLADAYSRRTGDRMNPAALAANMAGSGAYEPNRGTSVGSMVATGSALGMGMRVGGVTQSSLKQASPTNPITLLGSGTGFGTKSGNSHYVNVVGTDKNGGAYVANPMTGRVERQSATSLALNSKLGLYGSGDEEENEYAQYGFNDETSSALERLRTLTSKLTEMFTGPSKSEEVKKGREEANKKAQADKIKQTLGDEYEAVEKQAKDQIKADNPQRDGESAEDYEKRIEKLWNKKGHEYVIKFGTDSAKDKLSTMYESSKSGIDEASAGVDAGVSSMEKIDLSVLNESTGEGSSQLGATMAPFSPIINIVTDISDNTSSKSPVHDYFAATSGDAFDKDDERLSTISTLNGGWYGKSEYPNKEGVGSKGNDSEAIVINNTDKDDEVRAITGGTVTYVTRGGKHGNLDPNGGLGNSVKWRDDAGMYHWYFHLDEVDKAVQEGSNIEPNQVLGKFGSTGMTGRNEDFKLLRYMVTKSNSRQTGDDGHINPLTYWQFQQASDELTGDTEKEQIFNYLVGNLGIPDKGAAGIMGVWEEESHNTAATLEGNYAFDAAKVAAAPKSNEALNKYTVDDLFPMYARSGVGIDKNAYKGTDGNYYPGFGLAQWTGPRGKKVMDYAKENSQDWTELGSQLAYVKDELPAYGDLLDKIKKASTPEKAADIWMTRYEAGGQGENPHNTWLSSSQIDAREKNAGKLYSELHGHVTPATNTVDKKDGEKITGRFISTVSNDMGTGEGFFSSKTGATMADFGQPTHDKVNITSSTSGDSPVHDFFGATGGGKTYSADGNWYGLRHNPNNEGQGSSGDSHGGIDILWEGGTEGKELHAITGGVVDRSEGGGFNGSGSNGGCGNNIRWKDSGGFLHWYMHMRDDPLLKAGDTVQPGQLLGYAGNTGNSYGAHLHYNINDPSSFNGYSSSGAVNPLTYFSVFNPTGGKDENKSSKFAFSGATALGFSNQNMYKPQDPSQEETTRPEGFIGPMPKGSGDVSDFWTDSVYGSNNVQMDVPPLDMSKLMDESNGNSGVSPIIVNKYDIKPDQTNNSELLDKMGKMTFNVRARRVEQLLEELIEKIDGDKPKPQPTTDATDTNLFQNNDIPEQVTRLSRG